MLPDNFANLSQAQKDQYFSTGKVGAVAGTNTMGASVLTPTINSATIAQQPAIQLPTQTPPQNLAPQVAGGNATIQANSQSLAMPATPATPAPTAPTPQSEAPTVTDSFVNSLKTKLGLVPQAAPAPVKQTADIAPVSAAAQGQQVAQDALNLAQNKVAGINAEIQALDLQSKADAVSLEGQGRGIDATILSRQASEISRQATIKAIPLQVKALAAQGEVLAAQAQVASAQGKTQMAQFLYENAQKQLDNAYTAQVANWQQNQDYQNKVYDAVSGFLDKQQQAILDEKKTQNAQDFQRNQSIFTNAMDNAQANKDISAQSKILAVDPKDPNYAQKISAINAGIKSNNLDDTYKRLQIQKLQQELAQNGNNAPLKLSASQKDDIATMDTVVQLANKVKTVGNQIDWSGVGGLYQGSTKQFLAKNFGTGSTAEQDLRNNISNIQGTIAKLRGGTSFTPNEQKLLETYTPTIDDSPLVIKSKLDSLVSYVNDKKQNTISPVSITQQPSKQLSADDAYAAYLKVVNGK